MIHIVLGTKAQLIKMAPVMACLKDRAVPYNFIFTGQHRATTQEMLQEFGLKKPDRVLYDGKDVVSIPQMMGWITRILWKSVVSRKEIFGEDRDGIVLVHGDTFSTVLGALMGRLAGLRVGHVESGLRSFRLFHPFPEELTRLATFRLSHVLFCPGAWAMDNVKNLRRERVDTGANTLADTLQIALQFSKRRDHLPPGAFALVSLHRYENIFKKSIFTEIVGHLERIAERRKLLFILHPPTESQLRKFGLYERLERSGRIELRPRYTYFDFVSLLSRAEFIITDGGSVQEESSYLGLPCLLMRRATERQEGLGSNAVLSDMNPAVMDRFLDQVGQYRKSPAFVEHRPSEIIVDAVLPFSRPSAQKRA